MIKFESIHKSSAEMNTFVALSTAQLLRVHGKAQHKRNIHLSLPVAKRSTNIHSEQPRIQHSKRKHFRCIYEVLQGKEKQSAEKHSWTYVLQGSELPNL